MDDTIKTTDDTNLADIHPIFSAPPREDPPPEDSNCKDSNRKDSATGIAELTFCSKHSKINLYKINIHKPTWKFKRHVIPLTGEELPFHPELGEQMIWTRALEEASTDPESNLLEGLLKHLENELKIVAPKAEPLLPLRFRRLSEIIGIRLRIMNKVIIDYSNHLADESPPPTGAEKENYQKIFQKQFQATEDLLESYADTNLEWPGSFKFDNCQGNPTWKKLPTITKHHFKIQLSNGKTAYYGNLKLSSDEASTYQPNLLPVNFKTEHGNGLKDLLDGLNGTLTSAQCNSKLARKFIQGGGTESDQTKLEPIMQAAAALESQIENLKKMVGQLKITQSCNTTTIEFTPPKFTEFDTYCLAVNYAVNFYADGHGPKFNGCHNPPKELAPSENKSTQNETTVDPPDPESSSSAYFTPPPPSSN